MALDLKAWLKEIGVKDDVIDTVVPHLAPAADHIEKGFLRQSDYSKQMDGLNTAKTELVKANDRLNAEMAEWATAQASSEPITKKMREDLAKAQGEVARLSSVITTRAQELQIDPKDILDTVPAVVTPPPATVDLSGYVKTDDINARLSQFADYFLTLPADLAAIAQEHHALTGQHLDTREIVAEVKRRAGDKANRNSDGTVKQAVDIRAIWTEKHDIEAKRTAQSTEKYNADIKAAEDRGRAAARSEQALPGEPSPGRHAPVFRKAGESREHLVQHAQRPSNAVRGDRISQAAAALGSGKYRQSSPGRPSGEAA